MRDRRQTGIDQGRWRGAANRVRYGLALVAVIATLLAVSALYKRQTCGCGGPGVPYSTIAIAAAATAAVALVAYLATEVAARRR